MFKGKSQVFRTKLFVSNIAIELSDEALRREFERYGKLHECDINKKDQNKVYAFLKFENHTSANRAKDELDGKLFMGRPISVVWAFPQCTLCVEGLEPYVTNEILYSAFQKLGTKVESAMVVVDATLKKSKGYGYVNFERKIDSKQALEMCTEGLFLIGPSFRPVHVEVVSPDEDSRGLSEREFGRPSCEINPRFAKPGTVEFEFAMRWRELALTQTQEEEALKMKHQAETQQMWRLQEEAVFSADAQESQSRMQEFAQMQALQQQQIALAQQEFMMGNRMGMMGMNTGMDLNSGMGLSSGMGLMTSPMSSLLPNMGMGMRGMVPGMGMNGMGMHSMGMNPMMSSMGMNPVMSGLLQRTSPDSPAPNGGRKRSKRDEDPDDMAGNRSWVAQTWNRGRNKS